MRTKMIWLFIIIFLQLSATVINVPADQPTIQAGINVAVNADTVLVQPGTYVENINYNGKNITLASLFLTTQDTSYISQTIIDGNQNGSVVTFDSGEDSTAVLSGFTITNGIAEYAGGIFCTNTSSPIIKNSLISSNYAHNGAGICCRLFSNPILINVKIVNNFADESGGGIYCYYSNPQLENTLVTNNTANFGAGILCWHSNPDLKDVSIVNNFAYHDGGGIFCWDNSNPHLEDVTISDNSVDENGGGIYCCINSNPSLLNSILWNNSPQEIYFLNIYDLNSITISYSDIQGGENGIVTNNNGTVNWLTGNIDADPLFLDAANGDYHLTEYSPCIDAGDPNSPFDPDGTITDMGAFYFDQTIGIENYELQISNFKLTNYPNPFNPSTTISFSLNIENTEDAEIVIYNVKGQRVKSFLINQLTNSQVNHIVWSGDDENGKPVSSGLYLYKLNFNGKTEAVKKCLLLK